MAEARLRKVVTVADELLLELGRPVAAPVRRVAAAAVISNPWAAAASSPTWGPRSSGSHRGWPGCSPTGSARRWAGSTGSSPSARPPSWAWTGRSSTAAR
ncbi:amino acid synthesis family protein [Streptomyces indonesiensis]